MRITADEVSHIAHLARLALSREEGETFRTQLSSILAYVDALNEVNTEGVEPTAHVLNIENVTREDRVQASLSAESALRNAPEVFGAQYRVPRIID